MQPVPEFGEFVAVRSARLLRVAYLLTRDWALAEDLLQTALAKAWSAWKHIDTDPEAYVRRILVTTYASWWRQRWLHERPTGKVPDIAGADEHRVLDEREQMLQALGRLPYRQRAVLVLRYYEDLSEAEIAETLGIARGTVKSLAAVGLANLRVDILFQGEPSAHHIRLAAVAERVRTRRRRTAAIIGAACAVVIALIIGYATSPAHRSIPHPQPLTTASPRQIAGLPEYHLGTRIAQAVELTPENPRTQLGWAPSPSGGVHLVMCRMTTRSVSVFYSVSDGATRNTWTCSAQHDGSVLVQRHVPPASPAENLTVQLEYAEGPGGARVAVPADFSLSYAVADNVDWSQYFFPPRPSQIPPLAGINAVSTTRITSDPADPMAPRTLRYRQPHQLAMLIDGTGPTRLLLTVDGVELTDFRKWSYEPPPLAVVQRDDAGSTVTLTITPQYATGPWVVELADFCDDDKPACPLEIAR